MVAEDPLTLAADTLYDINHVLFFCDCRKPFDLKNIEKILAHFAQDASSPPAACDCNMNIRACVHVKQHARDYLPVFFQTHASEGREKLHSKHPLHKGRYAWVVFASGYSTEHLVKLPAFNFYVHGAFMKILSALPLVALLPLAACAGSSDVMDVGNGNYMVSSHANHLAGGASGAFSEGYKTANKYCAVHRPGTHAIVVNERENTTYRSIYNGGWNQNGGGFSGGTSEIGHADLIFRCGN